jgi:ADP-heptose:LPS heptosyltransferase
VVNFSPNSWLAKPRLWLWGAGQTFRLGRPDAAFGFLGGLGDELLCTVPLVEWRQRGARNIWVMTPHPALFAGLDSQAHILSKDMRYPRLCERLGREFRYLSYARYDGTADRESSPGQHIIAEMCRLAGLHGTVRLRPYLQLSPAEITPGAAFHDYVAVQTSTLTAHVPMPNKQWPAARFQELIDRLTPRVRFVQLGSPDDPPLRGVTDLRGKTSLRETAAVLSQARIFIGLVGFLMHLARAVECPAVIIYGGRETPELTGYTCNVNLTNRPPCSPCWQRARCDYGRICMESIGAEYVIAAVESALGRPRGPLTEDKVDL